MGNGTSLCAAEGCASWYISCEVQVVGMGLAKGLCG